MAARPEQTPARTGAPTRRSPLRRAAGALLPKPSPPIDTGTCSICAYDLEGLPPWWVRDARCPECGSNIALARLGSDLAAEDPRALRSLTLGLDLLSTSIAVTVVVPILALLSMLAINSVIDLVTGNGNGWAPIEIIGAILLTGAPIIGAALWCIAWAMLAPATRKAGISPDSRAVRAVTLAASPPPSPGNPDAPPRLNIHHADALIQTAIVRTLSSGSGSTVRLARSRWIRSVSTSPATNPLCRLNAPKKGQVGDAAGHLGFGQGAFQVSTAPHRGWQHARSAWRSSGHTRGEMVSPGRTPLSALTPAGKRRWSSVPVAGRKPLGTSSA